VQGDINIRFLEKMGCEGDKRAFKFEGGSFRRGCEIGKCPEFFVPPGGKLRGSET